MFDHSYCQNVHSQSQNRCFNEFANFRRKIPATKRPFARGGWVEMLFGRMPFEHAVSLHGVSLSGRILSKTQCKEVNGKLREGRTVFQGRTDKVILRVRYKIPYTLNASYVCITDLKALTLTTVVSFISKWPAVSTFSSLFQSSQISYQIQPKIISSETGAQNQMLRSNDIYCLISNEAININTSNYQERRAIREMGPRMMTNQMSPSSGLI